ncbi:CbrC family protein [Burkholderia ubonensis]|nr:CbrC family protein [Burkholderia ubonensis]
MTLPTFRYHPDPLGTGSVVESDARCVCCGVARGYRYAGPVYAIGEFDRIAGRAGMGSLPCRARQGWVADGVWVPVQALRRAGRLSGV